MLLDKPTRSKQTFESIQYQLELFFTSSGKLRIGEGSEQTTTVEQFTNWAPTKTVFWSQFTNSACCKVSPLWTLQTGETIPPEKHVRIMFHQRGPSRVVKLTPTGLMVYCLFYLKKTYQLFLKKLLLFSVKKKMKIKKFTWPSLVNSPTRS